LPGVDWDAKGQKKAIFKIQGEGKTWAKAVDKEKGSFDYLMCVRSFSPIIPLADPAPAQ
jgi:hypothetical protein